jgi:hypothetical protein
MLAEQAELTEHVFWVVKQFGIKDPAKFLAYQVQLEAEAAPAKLGPPPKIVDIPLQSKSAGREPVTLENSPAMTSAAWPPRPVARNSAHGTTKAEVLARIKAAMQTGASLRHIAEGLAFAHQHFHASQRETGRAVGRDPSWVNRLLQWHRTGYKQSSPFGPTTRAGRTTYRQLRSPNNIQAAPTRPHRQLITPDSMKGVSRAASEPTDTN